MFRLASSVMSLSATTSFKPSAGAVANDVIKQVQDIANASALYDDDIDASQWIWQRRDLRSEAAVSR